MTYSEKIFGILHNQFHMIDSPLLRFTLLLGALIIVGLSVYLLARFILFLFKRRLKGVGEKYAIVKIVMESSLPARLVQIFPLLTVGFMVRGLFCEGRFTEILNALTHAWFIFTCAHIFSALMSLIYKTENWRRGVTASPQKGIFQVLSLVGYLFAVVGIIATFLGRDPTYILSGLTALSAVFMLVFKDSILGLTAGITLVGNGLVKIGDWIVVPGAGADGDVIDIALTTVRVQNFDKTITTVPAYDLISKPFTNWRGMVDAGGRRIKRAIQIDLDSIAFASEADLKRWKKIDLLKDYLTQKEVEITAANAARPTSKDSLANARTLTNIGTFRAYCLAYLRNHARVHQKLTLLVRQLPPVERGLPLEIYCFTNTTVWAEYEATQSDIFDHLLAILPEFGLSTFQVTSAAALRSAAKVAIH